MSMRSDGNSDGYEPVFQGRYGDGVSAETVDADVRLTETGIEITRRAPDEVLFWPYAGLAAAVPLGPHAIDVLLRYRYVPGATLFVAEGAFARRLQEHAPHLTARAVRRAHAAPWILAASAVVAVAALVWLIGLSPARGIARLIPDGTRSALGAKVIGSMTAGRRVCSAASGRAALDRLLARLGSAARGDKPFKVTVVDWSLVNAFAAPGEQIVLTRGLIDKAQSADEVAGVLAHEMGHGVELHPEAGIVRALGLAAATDLLLGGSGGTLANAGLMLAQLSYTRDAEREADRHAIRILREAAIPAQGLADFFSRIDKSEGGGTHGKGRGALDLLSTHPQSAERARAIATAPRYDATPALTATEWAALRAICPAGASKS